MGKQHCCCELITFGSIVITAVATVFERVLQSEIDTKHQQCG